MDFANPTILFALRVDKRIFIVFRVRYLYNLMKLVRFWTLEAHRLYERVSQFSFLF